MIKYLRIVLITLFAFYSSSLALASTFYSKIVLISDNAEVGEVQASYSKTKSGFSARAELTQSAYKLPTSTSGTHTYSIEARVKDAYKDQYEFVGWRTSNSANASYLSLDAVHETTITTRSTDKDKPAGKTVYAHFRKIPAVELTSNGPNTKFTMVPEGAQIGDEVTITCRESINGNSDRNFQFLRNMAYEFVNWTDENGNVVSTEETFKVKLDTKRKFHATYRNISVAPKLHGFYRIRSYNNRVLCLEGRYPHAFGTDTDGKTIQQNLMRWAFPTGYSVSDFGGSLKTDDNPPVEVEAMPSTIFYIAAGSGKPGSLKSLDIESQGISSKSTLEGQTFDMQPGEHVPEYYDVFKSIAIVTIYLEINAGQVYMGQSNVENDMMWQPIDVDNVDRFWFGAKPDETLLFGADDNDTHREPAYWTTMYTGFPYECYVNNDGVQEVEAYYVTVMQDGNNVDYLELNEVPYIDGRQRVPANTAVVLKCHSTDSKSNRMIPLDPAEYSIDKGNLLDVNSLGNVLKGEFQLYNKDERDSDYAAAVQNGTAGRKLYNADYHRELCACMIDGRAYLGFGKRGFSGDHVQVSALADDSAPQELFANKAYIDLESRDAQFKNPANQDFYSFTFNRVTTAVSNVLADREPAVADDAYYDILGRRVVNPIKGHFYIHRGKKIIY